MFPSISNHSNLAETHEKTRLAIVILASWARQMILRKVGWGDGCHGDPERNHGVTSWRCWNVTGWGWLSQCRGSSPESVDEIETTDDESSAVFQESSENVTIMLGTMHSVIEHHRNQQEESAEFWDSWQFVSHLPVSNYQYQGFFEHWCFSFWRSQKSIKEKARAGNWCIGLTTSPKKLKHHVCCLLFVHYCGKVNELFSVWFFRNVPNNE